MRWKPFALTVGLSVCLIVPVLAAQRKAEGPATEATAQRNAGGPAAETVGNFAAKLAFAMGDDASTPALAVNALRNRGVDLTDNLSAPLTRGEAARILGGLGVPVVPPANPSILVSSSMATTLAGTASLSSTAGYSVQGGGGDIGNVVACLHSADRGACIACCQGLLHGSFGQQVCPVLCKLNQPPPPSGSCPGDDDCGHH